MLKKAGLIFLISLMYCFAANAQQGVRYNMITVGPMDYVVASRDSADFYRIIFPPDTIDKKLFLINDYYKNGKPKLIGKTSNDDPRKISLQEMSISYFPTGVTKAEKNYENGKQLGEINEYFPNGKLYLAGNSDSNGQLTIRECIDSTGKVLARNGNGSYVEYDDNFKRICAEGPIVNGFKEGEWHGSLKDSARYVCHYEKGVSKSGIGYDKEGKEYPYVKAEQDPQFRSGANEFLQFLSNNINYPDLAKLRSIQGTVFVIFVVEKDGTLSHIRVYHGIGSGCDEEAVRVIKLTSPWTPGIEYGMSMPISYTVPVRFTLSASNK